jgi:NAD(P)-dependent dehydrogenase (short-subunit alcohol dehydrogenase family)
VSERNESGAPPTRVAAISGATSGIGLATAQRLATEGWCVALGGRRKALLAREVETIEGSGGRAIGVELDVRRSGSVDVFFDAVETAFGGVDAVVNCAAHARPRKLVELDAEEIESEISTGLIGALLFSRRALIGMLQSHRAGDVVFVSSTTAVLPWPMHTPYSAAKAGMEQASRSLARELEGTGIRSTVVRVGNTIGTGWADGWGSDDLATPPLWRNSGLIRHARASRRRGQSCPTFSRSKPGDRFASSH